MSRRRNPDHLEQRVSSLLQAASHDYDPTEQQRAAVKSALEKRLAQGPRSVEAAGKAAAGVSAGKLAVIAGGLALAALGAVLWSISQDVRSRDATPAALTAASVPAPRQSSDAGTSAQALSEVPVSERAIHNMANNALVPPVTTQSAPSRLAAAAAPKKRVPKPKASSGERYGQVQVEMPASVDELGAAQNQVVLKEQTTESLPPQPLAATVEPRRLASPTPGVTELAPDPDREPKSAAQSTNTRGPAAVSELALMQRIQAALDDGDAKRAYALTSEHAALWPAGSFQQEREGVRAIASCQLHLHDAASRARAFLSRYARSALAPRVQSECRLAANPVR